MSVNFAVRSNTGKVRTNNEDNFFCNGIFMTHSEAENNFFMQGTAKTPCIFAVCDGMGGEDYGETASLLTVETLSENFEKILNGSDDDVNNFVKDSNQKLLDLMSKCNIRTGTTLAMIVIKENCFKAYNLGDSRIYRLNNNHLLRITDDHTVAEEKVRMGLLNPKQAARSPERNMLTRCIGIYDDSYAIIPDSYGKFDTKENQRVLICSDGLTEMLSHKEMSNIITSTTNVSETVNKLTDSALEHGGRDNVTCIVIDF